MVQGLYLYNIDIYFMQKNHLNPELYEYRGSEPDRYKDSQLWIK